MTNIRVIDLETTGMDPEKDEIVEIAAADILDGRMGRAGARLIFPCMAIPPEASAIHHIIDVDVELCPKKEAVLPGFGEGADVFAAHNVKFDRAFLPGDWGPWICTYKCAVTLWPEAPTFSNNGLRYWLGLDEIAGLDRNFARMHRAGPDSFVTRAILMEMLKVRTIELLIEISDGPVVLPKFTFGKHAREPISEIPTRYLEWMLGQDFGEDEMHTVKQELKRRLEASG